MKHHAYIDIVPLENFHMQLVYPKYREGRIGIGVLPMGLSIAQFIVRMTLLKKITDIWYATFNGENVGLFESRPHSNGTEIHACWFTSSRRKRLLTGMKFVEMFDDAVIFVPHDDAKGHFALARKGILKYIGETDNVHEFRRAA